VRGAARSALLQAALSGRSLSEADERAWAAQPKTVKAKEDALPVFKYKLIGPALKAAKPAAPASAPTPAATPPAGSEAGQQQESAAAAAAPAPAAAPTPAPRVLDEPPAPGAAQPPRAATLAAAAESEPASEHLQVRFSAAACAAAACAQQPASVAGPARRGF